MYLCLLLHNAIIDTQCHTNQYSVFLRLVNGSRACNSPQRFFYEYSVSYYNLTLKWDFVHHEVFWPILQKYMFSPHIPFYHIFLTMHMWKGIKCQWINNLCINNYDIFKSAYITKFTYIKYCINYFCIWFTARFYTQACVSLIILLIWKDKCFLMEMAVITGKRKCKLYLTIMYRSIFLQHMS